jgi:hypothetical protein
MRVKALGSIGLAEKLGLGHDVLLRSVQWRADYHYPVHPTRFTVLTLWFHAGSYSGLNKDKEAWVSLRDAITHAKLLGMHLEETYERNAEHSSRMRALYWLLFIAER